MYIHFTLIIDCVDGEVVFVLDTVAAQGKSPDQVFPGQSQVIIFVHVQAHDGYFFFFFPVRWMNIPLKER